MICILRYVKKALEQGLLYKNINTQILVYCYADWADCPIIRRSTTGYYVFIGWNIMEEQEIKCCCNVKAKYRYNLATYELVWIKQLLLEWIFCEVRQMILYCDNQDSLHIASNLVFHDNQTHKDRLPFCQGEVVVKELSSRFINTNDQLADILTKPLKGLQFRV